MENPDSTTTSDLCENLHGFQAARKSVVSKRFLRGALLPLHEFSKDNMSDRLRRETYWKCKKVIRNIDPRMPSREEWENCNIQLRNAAGQLAQSSERELGQSLGLRWLHSKVCDLDKNLKVNNINRQDFLAWHIICGSTISYEDAPLLDLPKPFSIADFVSDLGTELQDREKCLSYINQKYPRKWKQWVSNG